MSKFHINASGEAGKCSATQGKCPFGGESQHYDSAEVARVAFELSMAGKSLPTVSKRTQKTVATKRGEPISRTNFDPEEWGNFAYDDVFYDTKDEVEKLRENNWSEEKIRDWRKDSIRDWESKSRTRPSQSYEKNVPIRLLPVGTMVEVYDGRRMGGVTSRAVGAPVDNGGGDIVGKYRDIINAWDYVGPDTNFDLEHVPADKNLSNHWKAANLKAAELKKFRAKAREITNPPAKNTVNRDSYNKEDFGGREYDDVVFDERHIQDKLIEADVPSQEFSKVLTAKRRTWDNAARTHIATSGEENVPLRVVPVGSEIIVKKGSPYISPVIATVLAPQIEPDGKTVGRYQTEDKKIVTAAPNFEFTVHAVPYGKKLSPRWKAVNERAEDLAVQREKIHQSRLEDLKAKLRGD
jgi:hypothetical protein